MLSLICLKTCHSLDLLCVRRPAMQFHSQMLCWNNVMNRSISQFKWKLVSMPISDFIKVTRFLSYTIENYHHKESDLSWFNKKWEISPTNFRLLLSCVFIRSFPSPHFWTIFKPNFSLWQAQLEPASKQPDPFNRMRTIKPPPVVEGGDVFEVERILGKRMSRKKTQYLVKWFGYGDEHNVWYNEEDLSEAQEAVKDYEFWLATHSHPQTQSRKKSSYDQDNAITPRHLHPIPPKPRDSASST